MDKVGIYKEYCTGCGLCASIQLVEFETDKMGFPTPILEASNSKFCEKICPASGTLWNYYDSDIWGPYLQTYTGWSTNEAIRKSASTGGILTALCLYLLENGMVDGIIQTRMNEEIPFETVTVISRTPEEVKACMGSRYSVSQPLKSIKQIIRENERYCFVGKPCDVQALKAYMLCDQGLKDAIPITLSFFCAGMPSKNAQKKLLERLDCKEDECLSLKYRGDGWPGFTVVRKKDGSESKITYGESWRQILGRDVRKCCRFCIDGIGTFSDIACGDCWNIKEGKIDVSEDNGRNVIFARSEIGERLLKEAVDRKYIYLEEYENKMKDLQISQYYQHDRKAAMLSMISAMKLLAKPVPLYPKSILLKYSKHISVYKRLRRFLGTIKRSLQNKL